MFTLRFALRNIGRNRLRSAATVLGVASLLFLVSFLVAILVGLEAATETDTSYRRLVASNKISLMFWLPESYWERIRATPHVVEASPWNWFGGTYIDEKNFFARFFVDPESFLEVMTDIEIPPEQARAWLANRQGALVSRRLARQFGFELGQRITIQGDIYPLDVELDVVAIYEGGDDGLYFHRAYVEEAMGRPGRVGTYSILVDDSANLAKVAEAIDAAFADSDAATKTQTEKAFQAGFVSMFGNVKALVGNLTAIIAVTILLTAGNTMAMAIRERRREMAVLKALGFLPARILRIVLAEAVALASIAGLLGVGAFWSISYVIFVVMDVRLPMVWFPLTLTPPTGTGLLLASVALGLVSGIVPALSAARVSILDGLRTS